MLNSQYASSRSTQTWSGTRATNSAMAAAGTAVLVGLFGLQTITRRVAAVISASIAVEVVLVTRVQRHADRASRRTRPPGAGRRENDGQAYTSSAPGSSSASPSASSTSHEPLPIAIRSAGTP